MNPLSRVTDTAVSTITHPRRTAETVVSEALGLAALGVRTATGVAGWAARRAGLAGEERDPAPWETPTDRPESAPAAADLEPTPAAADLEPTPDVEPAPAPFSEASVDTGTEVPEAEELTTPSGIPAADPGYNPDTAESDLFQPDTEPLMDPATSKAARSEAATMQKAADLDKG